MTVLYRDSDSHKPRSARVDIVSQSLFADRCTKLESSKTFVHLKRCERWVIQEKRRRTPYTVLVLPTEMC